MAHGVKKIPTSVFERNMMVVKKSVPEDKSKTNYYIALEEASYDLLVSKDSRYCKMLMKDVYARQIDLNKFKSERTEFGYKGRLIIGRVFINQNEWVLELSTLKAVTSKSKSYARIKVTQKNIKGTFDEELNELALIYQQLLIEVCSV